VTDLIARLRSQEAVDARPREIEQLTDEAADALEAANDRIAALTVKCGLLAASLDKADRETDALQASLDRLHGAKFSDRTYAALVDRAERNEVDAAIGRTVLAKTVILDGSIDGMTILTLASDAKGLLEYAVRKAVEGLSATKEKA
jgi:hypothetical protein